MYLVFFVLPIYLNHVFKEVNEIDYNRFKVLNDKNISIGRIRDPECPKKICVPEFTDCLINLFKNETGIIPQILDFDTKEEADDYHYNNGIFPKNMILSFYINHTSNFSDLKPNIYFDVNDYTTIPSFIERVLLNFYSNGTLHPKILTRVESTEYNDNDSSILIGLSVMTFSNVVIMIFIILSSERDFSGNLRLYLITYGLYRTAYWIGTFIVDIALLLIPEIIALALSRVYPLNDKFMLNLLLVVYGSIPVILMSYLMSWIIKVNKLVNIILGFLIIFCGFLWHLITSFSNEFTPFFCVIPGLGFIGIITNTYIFAHKILYPVLINGMMIILFVVIMIIAEYISIAKRRNNIKIDESELAKFQAVKDSRCVSQETLEMERIVHESDPASFKIRIADVCRYFHDSKENKIYAVNQVSLGIKEGCLFGLLGTNGAGKTTLMNIILKEIPLMTGSIQIDGHDIREKFSESLIGYCPQFTSHLNDELTVLQTFKFFSIMFSQSKAERERIIELILESLDLRSRKDTFLGEASAGVRQKVCVAIPFICNCNIIILDEPTSVLDPVSRRKVHQFINMYKGSKTFILCTHMLEEAESLCDEITIMMNGCIQTVGTPAFFANKYGKDWKFDLILWNDSEQTVEAVNNYIKEHLPGSVLKFNRRISRIYTIPSDTIKLSDLFLELQALKDKQIGVRSFTCSTSSLEKAFLELVEESQKRQQTNITEFDSP